MSLPLAESAFAAQIRYAERSEPGTDAVRAGFRAWRASEAPSRAKVSVWSPRRGLAAGQ